VTRLDRQLARLSTSDIAALPKEHAVVVLPMGAIEQHGPHLPVLTDYCVAEEIAFGAAEVLGDDGSDIWFLPTIAYGRSGEHLGYPGTFALSTETLLAFCRDIGRSAAASGFHRLAFVNAHGGNCELLEVVARDIRAETGLLVFPISLVHFAVPAPLEAPDASFSMHGGFTETSLLLALDAPTVHMERAEPGGRSAEVLMSVDEDAIFQSLLPASWLTRDLAANGVVGDPRDASSDAGKQIVDAWQRELARLYRTISAFEFDPLQ
jgi:creatinine amidohydrolase